MEYTTQMDAARKGIITEAMKQVADYENMSAETIRDLVAKGQVAIPANKNHTCLKPWILISGKLHPCKDQCEPGYLEGLPGYGCGDGKGTGGSQPWC